MHGMSRGYELKVVARENRVSNVTSFVEVEQYDEDGGCGKMA